MESSQPLSLGELADFFREAWPLIDVLEINFEGDLEASLDFFVAGSGFYRDLDSLCCERVIEHHADAADAE